MSSNLLKSSYTTIKQNDARVIDVNSVIMKRIEEQLIRNPQADVDGFVSGLQADIIAVEGLLEEGGNEDGQNAVIKAGLSPEQIKAEAEKEAEEILANARARASEIEQEAKEQARIEKTAILEQARQQGYAEGTEKSRKEAERLETEYRTREKELEAEYQKMLEELEPQFVDTITGIYEHIFHVELQSYREILCHLISTTMRKTEGNREFLIHVSKDDYPYISVQKKQLAAGATAHSNSVEIVEDITLGKGECLIETEGGIFDCGLGTQLTELRRRLQILSYEK